MKTIVMIAALAALGACTQKTPEAASTDASATSSPMAAASPSATPSAAASPNVATAGTYQVTDSSGKVTMETIAADGTYVDTVDGKVTEKGKWRVDGAKSCFTPEGKTETCFTASAPGPDGSFAVMGPDGKQSYTVKKTG